MIPSHLPSKSCYVNMKYLEVGYGLGKWLNRWAKHLQKHKDLSLDSRRTHKKLGVTRSLHGAPMLCGTEAGGWLGLAGCQSNSRFSETPSPSNKVNNDGP